MFTPEDRVFIRTILANPAELTAWLVYADWLDEHNNPLHAEFLRLEVRRSQLSNTEVDWYTAEERLKELRAAINPHWVAVFDRPKIENCDAAFRFRCPKQWENLKVTGDPAVRHCDACEKKVFFCRTLPEAQDHARRGNCVAVQLDVLRYPDDLKPRAADVATDLLAAEAAQDDLLLGMLVPGEPEPPPPWWKFWKWLRS
jgi:uncharacterized protein (TIGR02996 family)